MRHHGVPHGKVLGLHEFGVYTYDGINGRGEVKSISPYNNGRSLWVTGIADGVFMNSVVSYSPYAVLSLFAHMSYLRQTDCCVVS